MTDRLRLPAWGGTNQGMVTHRSGSRLLSWGGQKGRSQQDSRQQQPLSSLSGQAEQTQLFALKEQSCHLVSQKLFASLRGVPGWVSGQRVPGAFTREVVGDSHFITEICMEKKGWFT